MPSSDLLGSTTDPLSALDSVKGSLKAGFGGAAADPSALSISDGVSPDLISGGSDFKMGL